MSRINRNVQANYQSFQSPVAYVGNPLIEALPAIFSEDVVRQDLRSFPPAASVAERTMEPHERVHCVSAIDDLVIPLPIAFDVEAALSVMIRRGYAARNPFDCAWRREHFKIRATMSEPLVGYQIRSKSVPAMLLTAVSGGGKTTLAESLLEMYPQTITHTRYKEQSFNVMQLVWIGVNASFDASLKGLVLAMFGAVDAALGTDYRKQYEKSKLTIDGMLGNLAQVFTTHHLGVLFVDEIQCLMLRGSDEAKLALNLFLKIANVCKVPIVFGGTYAAAKLLSTVARNARRVCSGGYFDLALATSCNDIIWDKLVVEVVWKKYQWVPQPALLTPELRKLLFRLTQGILAVLIALHRASQIYAIRNGLKTVDATVLNKVYETQFVLLHPALDALRSNKRDRLEKFEDLLPPKEQMNSSLRPSNDEMLQERIQRLFAAAQQSGPEVVPLAQSIESALPSPVSEAGNSPEDRATTGDASRAAVQLFEQIGSNPDLRELAFRAGLISKEELASIT
jgi:hypothetical protein